MSLEPGVEACREKGAWDAFTSTTSSTNCAVPTPAVHSVPTSNPFDSLQPGECMSLEKDIVTCNVAPKLIPPRLGLPAPVYGQTPASLPEILNPANHLGLTSAQVSQLHYVKAYRDSALRGGSDPLNSLLCGPGQDLPFYASGEYGKVVPSGFITKAMGSRSPNGWVCSGINPVNFTAIASDFDHWAVKMAQSILTG